MALLKAHEVQNFQLQWTFFNTYSSYSPHSDSLENTKLTCRSSMVEATNTHVLDKIKIRAKKMSCFSTTHRNYAEQTCFTKISLTS